jgi:hypothetical protein
MARARNIKPGFFSNDELAECEPLARLLFAGLWLHCDREGRLEDRPKKIKAEILPYDDCDADKLLAQLQARGFIIRYSSEDRRYIQVTNFSKHQNPHVKEAPSDIPAPVEHSTSTVQVAEVPEQAGLNPESLLLNPESGIPQPETPAPAPASPPPQPAKRAKRQAAECSEEFEAIWSAYPRKPGMSRSNALKAFSARISEGIDPEAVLSGVRAYAAYVVAMGTEPQYVKSPETFLGPGKHWESDWTPPRPTQQARASPAYQTATEQARQWASRFTGGNRNELPSEPYTIDLNAPPGVG